MKSGVYQYIATIDPGFARNIIRKYGYNPTNVRTKADLGICMEKALGAQRGESQEAMFKEIMERHPDKDVILELYGQKSDKSFRNADGEEMDDSCRSCRRCRCGSDRRYSNADGEPGYTPKPDTAAVATNNQHQMFAGLMSTAIIAGSLILAVAIITRNN